MIENFNQVTEYVRDLFNLDKDMIELEKYAIENKIPIITREVLQFMIFTAKSIKAKNILEIGTAIGYSSIFLSKVANENKGELTTIEIDENRYIQAKNNFEKYKIKNVNQVLADANIYLKDLKESFDFIFIDASKSNYKNFFDLTYPLLNEEGIIFIDNILFKGYVAMENFPKRYKTIVRKLKDFISYLNDKYNFTLLPFGDGVAIIKMEGKK